MKTLALLLLAVFAVPAMGQTVASCPTATPGTVWTTKQWLPCPSAATYIAQPVPTTAPVSDMRCGSTCIFTWQTVSGILPTDQIWVKTAAAPTGTWVKAATLTFGTPTAPTPPGGSRALSWVAPAANVDGTKPATVTGYNVYSGPSATALTKLASVGPTVLTYSVTITAPTYFAVTAVNSAGESAQSAALPVPLPPNFSP